MADIYDGKIVTVTMSALRVQAALFLGRPMTYPLKSTLNEALNILPSRLPSPELRPTLKYMAIGNRGHVGNIEPDGLASFTPVGHRFNDSGMFANVPFVLRPLDNDLGDDIRARYALRRKEEHGGRWYWAYYLKRLDMTSVNITDTIITRTDGVETPDAHAYTDNQLYPTPPTTPDFDYDVSDKTSVNDGVYATTGARLTVQFDEFDSQEYLKVTAIMRGNSRAAIISEIALCSGVDTPTTGESDSGSSFVYEEAIGVQVSYYLTCFNNIAIVNDQLAYDFEIGQDVAFYLGATV